MFLNISVTLDLDHDYANDILESDMSTCDIVIYVAGYIVRKI